MLENELNGLRKKQELNIIIEMLKPLLKYFRFISRQFNANPHEMIMVGDQLITDVLFANRAHMESILVVPVTGVNESNRLMRLLENLLYKRLAQKYFT